MSNGVTKSKLASGVAFVLASSVLGGASALAQDASNSKFDIYGFIMLDTGYQSGQNDPNWFDVLRPTKLPAFENEYGEDGRWFAGVRQTRLGVKSSTPTSMGDLTTQFEFEMFGTGVDAGQTTMRLRHAYGELGQFGAGQTWSPFMDIDVFPNSVEYWGPPGMAFFRNVQVRWMPIKGDTRLTVALERPGASADAGDYANRVELNGVTARFPYPDLSAEFRWGQPWGYIEAAGIVRAMKWDDMDVPVGTADASGSATGFGINLSTNVKIWKGVIRASVVYGEGIQNYMNDAPADVGVEITGPGPGDFEGVALPLLGLVAFYDINWSDAMSTSIGYSSIDIDNSNGQSADAFQKGDYALANVMFYPVKGLMFGPEVQWGKRTNNRDGFTSDDLRVQFSVKYNFGVTLGGR
jgi:hypothetical protein